MLMINFSGKENEVPYKIGCLLFLLKLLVFENFSGVNVLAPII